MKPGEYILLKRSKRTYPCKVLADHRPGFPALTILRGDDEWIVGANEIVSPEDVAAEAAENKRKELDSVSDIVQAFSGGHNTVGAIAKSLGKAQVQVLSRCRKAERLGLIKLERARKREPKPEPPVNGDDSPTLPGV